MRRRLGSVLIGLSLLLGVGVVFAGPASATTFAGTLYRFNGPTLSMNVQSYVNTTGNGGIQAVTKFWCFMPNTNNGYYSCMGVSIPGAGVRLYHALPGGGYEGINVRTNIPGCGLGGAVPACPQGVYAIATTFMAMGSGNTPYGGYYFGQTGLSPNDVVYVRPDAGSPWFNAGIPSSGVKGPVYG